MSVNRLVTVKRVASQLEILALLRSKHNIQATCDIIGEGPEQAPLEAQAQALGLGSAVRFLGGKANDEVLNHYQEYDGFLATSAAEGLGLSLIEALAAGLRCFSSQIPAYQEVASVGGGVTFIDPETPTEAAAAIADAVTGASSPVANLEALAAAFDASHFADRMLELYQ